jgi:dienelactone hydrolase
MTETSAPREQPSSHEIVLFHSLLGLRRAVLQWAERLRAAGHTVHTPDLYDGEVFDEMAAAARKIQAFGGFDELLARSQAAVSGLPCELVYAGFSNGGVCAELLAATRTGARGAILMHAPLPIRDLGWKIWPATVPVQVHFAEKDPLRSQQVIDALSARVRDSGANFQQCDYPGSGHLFADLDWPGYSEAASELMWERMLEFLARLAAGRKRTSQSANER